MKTSTKVILGVTAAGAVMFWALTTKNEVVESIVFPLKVKLRLAHLSAPDGINSFSNVGPEGEEAQKIFAQVVSKTPLGYVPIGEYVTGGHIYYNMYPEELQKLWELGYTLMPSKETEKGSVPKLVVMGAAEKKEMLELHEAVSIGLKDAKEQLVNELLMSNKYPEVVSVYSGKFGRGDVIVVGLLKNVDHSKILARFPDRKYANRPIVFTEMDPIRPQWN